MSKFVLTFVHGTWGRGMIWPSGDALWTTEASTLCRSLQGRLGPDVVFRRFRWSGRNSHTARLNASKKLRDFLQEGLAASPDATHIVIAHSHGGNVTLMALGDSNLRERIAGVACLATPFIAARDRNIGRDPWAIIVPGSLGLYCCLIGLMVAISDSPWVVLGLAAIACGLLVGAYLLLRKRVIEHASILRGELSPRPLEKDKLLLIRSPGDEASGALAIFQFFSQATVRLFLIGEGWYAHVGDLVQNPPGKLFLIGAFAAVFLASFFFLLEGVLEGVLYAAPLWSVILLSLGAIVSMLVLIVVSAALFEKWIHSAVYKKWFFRPTPPWLPPWLSRFGGENPLLWEIGLFFAALTWLIIPLLSVLLVLPFGWQAALANILLDVTAENTPPGSWEIHLIEPPTSEEIGGPVPPLMHKVYENPRVQRELSEWIETRGSGVAKIA